MDYSISASQIFIISVLVLWDLFWKGIALWRAARRHDKYWFIVLLLINSVGFLPIIYILMTEQRGPAIQEQAGEKQ